MLVLRLPRLPSGPPAEAAGGVGVAGLRSLIAAGQLVSPLLLGCRSEVWMLALMASCYHCIHISAVQGSRVALLKGWRPG